MWRRIVMASLISLFPLEFRPIIGSGFAAFSIVVVVEAQPYHDAATNTLATAAMWQLLITCVGL